MASEDAAVSQEEAVAEGQEEMPTLGEIPSNGGEPEMAEEKVDKPAAALGKANHKVMFKVGEGEGVELQLEPECPAGAALLVPLLGEGLDEDGADSLELIRELVGPGNYRTMLRKINAEGFKIKVTAGGGFELDPEIWDAIGATVNKALAAYGLTPGESQASPKS